MFVFDLQNVICIFLLTFTIQSSSGLKLINFNKFKKDKDETLILLKDIIKAAPEMIKLNRLDKEISGKDERKVLLKTIVPHKKPYTIEYDEKSNALYIPLIRIHKSQKNKQNPNIYIITEDSQKVKNKKNYLEHVTTLSRVKDKKELQKHIDVLTNKLQNRIEMLKKYENLVHLLKDILRTPQFEKSGEDNDPSAPGKGSLGEEEMQETEKRHKVWIPHYPPWNYWTYKKTIHQDMCPGNQVKIGNMCIWVPPH